MLKPGFGVLRLNLFGVKPSKKGSEAAFRVKRKLNDNKSRICGSAPDLNSIKTGKKQKLALVSVVPLSCASQEQALNCSLETCDASDSKKRNKTIRVAKLEWPQRAGKDKKDQTKM
jgi:hypothetical protein